jgi:hypothetical protein
MFWSFVAVVTKLPHKGGGILGANSGVALSASADHQTRAATYDQVLKFGDKAELRRPRPVEGVTATA